ncbi:MAG: lytic transglycosylase domain-containing protein [Firmicutes bacterium]|nr:lytic transglycosylase domain-containing protein [Bacillota bacterium]
MARFFRFAFLFVVLFAFVSLFTFRPFVRLIYPLKFFETIEPEAEKRDLDPYLIVAMIQVESGFRPEVVSPKGAVGLMQIMPDTAEWIANQIELDFEIEQLKDPEINIKLGTWYLYYLNNQFPSLLTALAAYNGGQGNVRQWLQDNRWDGRLETIENIPFHETREYVRRVLVSWEFYRSLYQE